MLTATKNKWENKMLTASCDFIVICFKGTVRLKYLREKKKKKKKTCLIIKMVWFSQTIHTFTISLIGLILSVMTP